MRLSHRQRAARRRQIAAEVLDNGSVSAAARRHGVTIATVISCCRAAGFHPRAPLPTERALRALRCILTSRKSFIAIAREIGLSLPRVYQLAHSARAAGFDVPGPRETRSLPTQSWHEAAQWSTSK